MTPSSPIPLRRGGNQTFGRRLGRPLSAERKSALALLDTLAISPETLQTPATVNPRDLFTGPVDKVFVEIGFGSGEHLLARMIATPDHGFIAAEPYINGMSAMLVGLQKMDPCHPGGPKGHPGPSEVLHSEEGPGSLRLRPPPCVLRTSGDKSGSGIIARDDNALPNLRVYMNDGLHIIHALAPASVDGIYVLNPDPWPKKKHHKRRIINFENLAAFARVIRPGGTLTLSTDVLDYATWMIEHLSHVDIAALFTPTDQTQADPSVPPADWPLITRYMNKGINAGRKPHYLVYVRK